MSLTIYNRNNVVVATVDISDESHHYKALCGDDYIKVEFELAEHLEVELLSYILVDGVRYTLLAPMDVTCVHSRKYEYVAIFEAMQSLLKRYRFRNPVDGRVKFSLTAKPKEHLQMLVDNLSRRDQKWRIGECVTGYDKVINYEYLTCFEALELMAQEFETEWEIVDGVISLHKVSYDKSEPMALSYGKGNGFVSGVARKNFVSDMPINVVYPQGGERNIDPSKYGNNTLLLPAGQNIRYDGMYFEDEPLYDDALGIDYNVDIKGAFVTRTESLLQPSAEHCEGTLDCTEIYPQREGVVTDTILRGSPDKEYNYYDIVDDTIPMSLNYEDYRIAGEDMVLVFQSGMLAGKEFVVSSYVHNSLNEDYPSRRFELISREYDGVMMPNVDFAPAVGDKYAIFGIALPDDYVCNNTTKSGASWDMLRKCVRHLHDNAKPKYTFTGNLDKIYIKANNLLPRLKVGAWVSFTNEGYQREPMLVRIVGIKANLNNPEIVEIDISEQALSPSTRIQMLKSNASISAAISEASKRAELDNYAIKAMTTGMGNNSLERKLGILIGDDFDKSARTIATEVTLANIPTAIATATQKIVLSDPPAKNGYQANMVYEWQTSPDTLDISALSTSDDSFDSVWTIRFGCTSSTQLNIVPRVYWKDGVSPTFGAWGICELIFRKDSSTGIYLGEWKVYR